MSLRKVLLAAPVQGRDRSQGQTEGQETSVEAIAAVQEEKIAKRLK